MARGRVEQLPRSVARRVSERRSHERLETRMDAMLHLHGRMQRVTIHNISRGGMKLKDAFGLTTGDVLPAEFLSHHAIGGVVV